MEKKAGRVINMYKVMAHKPNVLAPFLEFYKRFGRRERLTRKSRSWLTCAPR